MIGKMESDRKNLSLPAAFLPARKLLMALVLPLYGCSLEGKDGHLVTDSTNATDESSSAIPTSMGSDYTGEDPFCGDFERLVQLDSSLAIPPDALDAGLALCDNGLLHRDTPVYCSYPMQVESCPCNGPCSEFGDGVCHRFVLGCGCAYPCVDDGDCPASAACLCASGQEGKAIPVFESQCVAANCRSDADCFGYSCAATRSVCGSVEGLYCHSHMDECVNDSQCFDLGLGNRCAFDLYKNSWSCSNYDICE